MIDYETSAPMMLRNLMPSGNAYAFKAAVYSFNFSAVTKLNLRWMSSCAQAVPVRLIRVAMLKERSGSLLDVRLRAGNKTYRLVPEIDSGETLDVFPDGQLTVCKEAACRTTTVGWPSGDALAGQQVSVDFIGDSGALVSFDLDASLLAVHSGEHAEGSAASPWATPPTCRRRYFPSDITPRQRLTDAQVLVLIRTIHRRSIRRKALGAFTPSCVAVAAYLQLRF